MNYSSQKRKKRKCLRRLLEINSIQNGKKNQKLFISSTQSNLNIGYFNSKLTHGKFAAEEEEQAVDKYLKKTNVKNICLFQMLNKSFCIKRTETKE